MFFVLVLMEYLFMEHLGQLTLTQENRLNLHLLVQQRQELERQQMLEDLVFIEHRLKSDPNNLCLVKYKVIEKQGLERVLN
uniref:Uncharacterized protein n=1 Tax=Tanacetum cinerariifolium TaxID=118510 RepID=A0A6L2LJN3_TANCI|nr:hypothetical protein [Tanacetum cinerariifolium]